MAEQAYYDWIAAGRPYKLCRPGQDFLAFLEAAGYTVFHYPDDRHLQAEPPEDHTPFSATGWPVTSARWVGHAIDIMPTPGKPPLWMLAGRLIADRQNRVPGALPIKYINWTDEGGTCRHESWQPDRRTVGSTDKGHIHVSLRSDMDGSDVVSKTGYNPLEVIMANTPDDVAESHRILAFATLDPKYANDPRIVPGGRLATVPFIDAVKRIDVGVADLRASMDDLQGRPVITAEAFIAAMAAHPEIIDAMATAVAARVGMIPTAVEIAHKVGELAWHGRPE